MPGDAISHGQITEQTLDWELVHFFHGHVCQAARNEWSKLLCIFYTLQHRHIISAPCREGWM